MRSTALMNQVLLAHAHSFVFDTGSKSVFFFVVVVAQFVDFLFLVMVRVMLNV